MKLAKLTPEDISQMSYNELIGLVRETNRPPGGYNSIFRIAQRAWLDDKSKVLEIGTSTGVTAIELARTAGCQITAIDINENSLEEAAARAKKYGVANRISFEQVDATHMPYSDSYFDMVFCGNVTSLVSDREKALQEYSRVLKTGGFLSAIPMYYIKKPSDKLVADISSAIRVNIAPQYRDEWTKFFDAELFERYWQEDYTFDNIGKTTIDTFVDEILQRQHLTELTPEAMEQLQETYGGYMQLFRYNLAHMGYSLLLMRKETEKMDPELFTSRRIT